MDDLAATLTQFLSSPEGMEQVRAVADALGMSTDGEKAEKSDAAPELSLPNMADPAAMRLITKAAAAFSKEDKNTALLKALKPHFSAERAKKVDDAVRIMQLLHLMPTLGELGLFDREGRK